MANHSDKMEVFDYLNNNSFVADSNWRGAIIINATPSEIKFFESFGCIVRPLYSHEADFMGLVGAQRQVYRHISRE